MLKIISEGFGLGIATGLTCLTTCSSIYIPFLISQKRSIWNSSLKVLEISLGRFLAYVLFGAVAGFTGSKISHFNREIFTASSYILISIYLIISAYRTHKHTHKCAVPKFAKFTQSGFLLGIITGINFCPSFLLAISDAFGKGGAISGSLLFLGFFFGTTLYLIPLIFVGGISKIKKMQVLAKYISIIVGIYFLSNGVIKFYEYYQHKQNAKNSVYIDIFAPKQKLSVVSSKEDVKYFLALRDSLKNHLNGEVEFLLSDQGESSGKVVFIQKKVWEKNPKKFANEHKIIIDEGYDISTAIQHLKKHVFKTSKPLQWKFENK